MIKNGITLLSAHDPKSKCERAANAIEVKDRTLYFCPSPLYGYGVNILAARLKNEASNSRVLCIEADPELYELFTAEDDNVLFTKIIDPEKLSGLIHYTWGARAFRRIEMIKFSGGWQLFPNLYNSLFDTLHREIANNWSNALTLAKLGRLYIRNFFKNLPLIPKHKTIADLSFGGSDILVCGAGPSLDKALDRLCITKKRDLKIICVDTALGAFKDRGITPDLAVILESQHWNINDFTGCSGWNVPAAFDLSALPASADILGGELYLFMTPWTELNIFKRLKEANLLPDLIPPLGSVGLTAMEIARGLTTGNIATAGLDFCFTMDKYHARGTPGHRKKLNRHNRLCGLIGDAAFNEGVIKEGDVYTNPVMRNYRELFDREFVSERRIFTQRHSSTVKRNIEDFIQSEIDILIELRDILTGNKHCSLLTADCSLLNECNYLYAHFPDYAGGTGTPKIEDISFLKRVRIEIDFMLKLLEDIKCR